MTGGRPLRFLALVIGGWSALRTLALWPGADPLAVAGAVIGVEPAAASTVPMAMPLPATLKPVRPATVPIAPSPAMIEKPLGPSLPAVVSAPLRLDQPQAITTPQLPPPLAPPPLAHGASRIAGSAWLIARGGNGPSLIGSQLGASQAGVRVTYALGSARKVALSARIAAPLRGRGIEAGLGIDWQPTRAPIHVIVEQRVAIDGGRGGPAALIVGGVGPVEPIRGLRVEAYGQAGAIRRDRIEGFADGAARVAHPLVRGEGLDIDIGAGAWGGAQRGAERLDIGPTLGVSVPVANRRVRMMVDWRERVAGRARPGSGLAVSLGTDF